MASWRCKPVDYAAFRVYQQTGGSFISFARLWVSARESPLRRVSVGDDFCVRLLATVDLTNCLSWSLR